MLTVVAERTLRDRACAISLLVLAAMAALYVNQIGFVYALKTTSASVIALILAATPIFAALIGLALRHGAAVAAASGSAPPSRSLGVALVALGSGGEISGDFGGVLLGILTAATWAVYSIAITPLMRRYSPSRDQRRRARAAPGCR